MNVDWPQLIVPGLAVVYLGSAYLHDHWHDLRNVLARAEVEEEALRARFAPYVREEADSIPVRDGMPNIAMNIGKAWPCDHIEENWCSGECADVGCGAQSPGGIATCTLPAGHPGVHERATRAGIVTWADDDVPRGRHHVVHVITELPEPDDEWWTR